jgi:hypothetical protein
VAVMLAAFGAHAGVLTWDAPPECPNASALRTAIERRHAVGLEESALDVDVRISRTGEQLAAMLDVRGEIVESRALTSSSCEDLTEAIAVIVARLASMLETTVLPREDRVQGGSVPDGGHVDRARVRDLVPDWNGGARIAGVVGAGRAPQPGVAAEVGGWVSRNAWFAALTAARWTSSTEMLEGSLAGVEIRLTSLVVRAGYRGARRGARLRTWVVAELGSLRGRAVALEDGRVGTARWSAVGAGGGWALWLSPRTSILAAAEGEIVLDRARFAADSGTVLFRSPRATAVASLVLEVGWR